MFENCSSCGTSENLTFYRIDIDNRPFVYCRDCRTGTRAGLPDVWYGYGSGTHSEENIAYPKGHPNQGQPIPFSSRQGKIEAMKLAGVREAGDRNHGAR